MPSSEVMHKFKHNQLHSGSKGGPLVKNRSQAVAIMLSEQRAEKAHGGKYPERKGYQMGGMPMMGGMPNYLTNGQTPPPGPPRGSMPALPPNLLPQPPTMGGFPSQAPTGLGMPNFSMFTPPTGTPPMGAPPMGMGRGYQMGGPANVIERQGFRDLMHPGFGGPKLHMGPILSTVGGRTDQHAISVPSGSYVFPAAHVAALGQGNTINGLKVLSGMFGPSIHNPRGMGIPRATPPRPMPMSNAPAKLPASMQADGGSVVSFDSAMARRAQNRPAGQYEDEKAKAATRDVLGRALGVNNVLQIGPQDGSSEGGARGGHVGKPVDILAAGGEFVLGPDQVMRVGNGDLDKGHRVLDAWVQRTHKKFAKTIANLPPPAKS